MSLSKLLADTLAKNVVTTPEKDKIEIVYGMAKVSGEDVSVMLDGSDIFTPAITTVTVDDGERVSVVFKNHTALITGNVTNKAARLYDVDNQISESEKTAQNTYATKSSLTQTASEIRTEVSAVETNANSYTDTQVSGAKTYTDNQISESEKTAQNTYATKSSLTQTASEIRTEVSAVETNANSYTDTQVSGAKTYTDNQISESEKTAQNTYATKSSLTQTADSITSTVSSVKTTADSALETANGAKSSIDNLSVGGRNLFLNTGVEKSNNNYNLATYTYANEPLVAGETYTWTICITPAENIDHIDLYVSDGNTMLARAYPSGTEKQIISKTFTASYKVGKEPTVLPKYGYAMLFRFPNDGTVTANTTIHWMKIEKGNTATDWTPAPEDVETSTIEQLKNNITLSVTDGSVGKTAKITLGIDDKTKEASIDLTGAVSFSDLTTSGKTTINGSNITTGTIAADRIDVNALMAKHLTSTGGLDVTGGFTMTDNGFTITKRDNSSVLYIGHDPSSDANNSSVGLSCERNGAHLVANASDDVATDYGVSAYVSGAVGIYATNLTVKNPNLGNSKVNATVNGDVSITGNLTAGNLESGSWTPTIYGGSVSSYSTQQGWYLKFGNVVIVGWYMYVDFASGQTSKSYAIEGLPYNPVVVGTGGGVCSGFFADEQIDFAGWYANTDGKIYGQGTANGYAGDRWTIGNIFCGTTSSFSSGTIIYTTSAT